ncbi:sugar phosphate isomerase/epimerase family protein [Maribacter halichondriae]|uniref:sugar phosphate isomerase/epimerase family protein n=1 Tax=Maribacter halichondriae TaxID=2980554 RepID=UPI002358830C|nr:sugar phosphate isomerase/epimerase family protein [Maribacter sp. Hal144]
MKSSISLNRRSFVKKSSLGVGSILLAPSLVMSSSTCGKLANDIPVNAHLWVYASKFPPNWDCTPVLNTVFSDLSYAGIKGVEIMEGQLRHDDSVERLNGLIKKYNLPVSGSSYGVGFNMWDASQHQKIMDDIKIVVPRLAQVGGKTFGISVGGKKGLKTEAELDAQADILKKIRTICNENGFEANLHNHTYEVENDMHDLKGTLKRIPDFKLGPDLNWLIRGGIDPVEFITTYGKQIVYLHIRDQYQDGTWSEYLGQGDTDFEPIAEVLKAQNFNGQAAIELAFPNDFEPKNELKEDWKMSREFVQKTFGW